MVRSIRRRTAPHIHGISDTTHGRRVEPVSALPGSGAHDRHDDGARVRLPPVLEKKNTLPGAKRHPTMHHRDDFTGAGEHHAKVGRDVAVKIVHQQLLWNRKARERYESWLRQLRADAIVEIRY